MMVEENQILHLNPNDEMQNIVNLNDVLDHREYKNSRNNSEPQYVTVNKMNKELLNINERLGILESLFYSVRTNSGNQDVLQSDFEDESENSGIKTEDVNIIIPKDEQEAMELMTTSTCIILRKQIKFLLVSSLTMIVSLIALVVYYITGLYIIHPLLYIFTFVMGLGWGATAVTSIYTNKKEE